MAFHQRFRLLIYAYMDNTKGERSDLWVPAARWRAQAATGDRPARRRSKWPVIAGHEMDRLCVQRERPVRSLCAGLPGRASKMADLERWRRSPALAAATGRNCSTSDAARN